MDGEKTSLGVCWSCQSELLPHDAVLLDFGTAIQCCRECWQKIPSEERMSIALRFHDRSLDHGSIGRACDAIVRLVDQQILEIREEEDLPPWDRGDFGSPDWN